MEYYENQIIDEINSEVLNWCNTHNCYIYTDNGISIIKSSMVVQTEKEQNENELRELLHWFNYYDNQVNQYNRCQRLGILFDKDIKELDNQAKNNALRVSELRKLLNKPEMENVNSKGETL